jgi:hypothetical protein
MNDEVKHIGFYSSFRVHTSSFAFSAPPLRPLRLCGEGFLSNHRKLLNKLGTFAACRTSKVLLSGQIQDVRQATFARSVDTSRNAPIKYSPR